jgi:hypothetical protein
MGYLNPVSILTDVEKEGCYHRMSEMELREVEVDAVTHCGG